MLTRYLCSLLEHGSQVHGFAYADVAGPTTGADGQVRPFFANPHAPTDPHLDSSRTYTHWLEALAHAGGLVWCSRESTHGPATPGARLTAVHFSNEGQGNRGNNEEL